MNLIKKILVLTIVMCAGLTVNAQVKVQKVQKEFNFDIAYFWSTHYNDSNGNELIIETNAFSLPDIHFDDVNLGSALGIVIGSSVLLTSEQAKILSGNDEVSSGICNHDTRIFQRKHNITCEFN